MRRADERRLGAARSNLADIDNKIASDQQAIMNLNAEADSLNRDLPRAQEEVRRGQAGYDQAQRAWFKSGWTNVI